MEHQKYIKLIAKIAILLLAASFLLLPGIIREENTLIGDKPYHHLSLADKELNFSSIKNELSFGWSFILRYISVKTALFVLGLASALLLFLNLEMMKLNQRLLAAGLFVLSPAFIYMFNVGDKVGIAFAVSLIISYLIIKERYKTSIPLFILLPFLDVLISIFVLIAAGLYFIYLKTSKSLFYYVLLLFILGISLFGEWNFEFISDLGAFIGISVFALVFALFCFILFWREFLPLYGILLIMILLSLKFEFGIFYLSAFISILLSLCISKVYDRKWESELIRNLTILFIFCGLLFSGISYANRLSQEMPNESLFKALEILPEGSVVFSDIGYGNWIKYSGKESVWDTSGFLDKAKERELNSIIDSKDAFITRQILSKYKVDYVLIDSNLMEKWNERGIFYLLDYDYKGFRQIYDQDGVIIWRHFK